MAPGTSAWHTEPQGQQRDGFQTLATAQTALMSDVMEKRHGRVLKQRRGRGQEYVSRRPVGPVDSEAWALRSLFCLPPSPPHRTDFSPVSRPRVGAFQ